MARTQLPVQEMQETWVRSLGQEDPLEEEMAPAPAHLPGEPPDGGAWQTTVHRAAKCQTRLRDSAQGTRSDYYADDG